MRISTNKGLITLGVILFFYACTDDYFEFDKIKTDGWSPELALPAINSSLTLADIVVKNDTSQLVEANSEGVLELVYRGNVSTSANSDIIAIPNQVFSERIESDTNVTPPFPFTQTFTSPLDIAFSSPGEIDSVLLKGGEIGWNFTSTFNHSIDLTIEIPEMKDPNGNSFRLTQAIMPNQSNITPTTPLDGYFLDLTKNGTTHSTLEANITARVSFIAGNPITSNDFLSVTGDFRNIEIKEFSGYIPQQTKSLGTDTIFIEMFNNFKKRNGSIRLTNPTLEIDIKNSFGIEADLVVESLTAFNAEDQAGEQTITLPTDVTTNNKIRMDYNANGTQKITNILFDSSNTNIKSIVEYLLQEIRYKTSVEFNPTNDPSKRNFLTDTSNISLDVALRLPFAGAVDSIYIIDTIPMDLSITNDIESGTIRTIVDNGFPVDVSMQLVFTDSSYTPIDSLYASGVRPIMPAAPIDANGDAIGKSRELTDTQITDGRFQKLKNGKHAIIIALMSTQDFNQGRNVRFKAGYTLDVAVSIRAKAKIN